MEKGALLYEGKAKKIYATADPELLWVEYKDDATAFNGQKKGTIAGKGELNNRISARFFALLRERGIENHFVRLLSSHEQLVRKVTIVPLEVVVRNVAAGSLAQRLGIAEGTKLAKPVVEFYYKNDALGDPLLNDSHIEVLALAAPPEVAQMRETALRVNDILSAYMAKRRVLLVDFKLEFGRTADGGLLLADEISPDTCRFWDAETGEKMDKDRFRRDLGGVEAAYREILRRLGGTDDV
ncbi:phosphoribosylaminoimidazolesuccinocarboxamide synthase [Bacillaceae bacterium]